MAVAAAKCSRVQDEILVGCIPDGGFFGLNTLLDGLQELDETVATAFVLHGINAWAIDTTIWEAPSHLLLPLLQVLC